MKTQTKKTAAKTATKNTLGNCGARACLKPATVRTDKGPRCDAHLASKQAPTNKIVIVDACATAYCEKAPVAGSSYCAEHKPLAAAAEKALDRLDKDNAKRAEKAQADLAKQKAEALREASKAVETAEKAIKAAAKAKSPKVAKAELAKVVKAEAQLDAMIAKAQKPAAPAPAAVDARATIAQLIAKGWTQGTIAAALSTSPGRVWFWNSGKNCRRLADLQSLVFQTVPRKDLVVPVRSGSLKVKAATAATSPKAARLQWEDERQLALELVYALLSR